MSLTLLFPHNLANYIYAGRGERPTAEMFKLERRGDGQIDRGNPLCFTLTCLQTHFSWSGMRAKQNRMLSLECFASGRGGLRLGFENETSKITPVFLPPIWHFANVLSRSVFLWSGCYTEDLLYCSAGMWMESVNTLDKHSEQTGLSERITRAGQTLELWLDGRQGPRSQISTNGHYLLGYLCRLINYSKIACSTELGNLSAESQVR